MRIKPARLTSLMLGKSYSPFYNDGVKHALILLSKAGIETTQLYEKIYQDKGSSLWLEDSLQNIEEVSPCLINSLLKTMIKANLIIHNTVSYDEYLNRSISFINKQVMEFPYYINSNLDIVALGTTSKHTIDTSCIEYII